ncbi:MAG: glycoside hydrolase family 95 protein [Terriglobales bacterium]
MKDASVEYSGQAGAPAQPLSLWYRRPATEWVQAVPVGNGRLGAMVFGGINREILQLNEDTVWPGGPHDYSNPDALTALPEVRRMVFAGQYKEAEDYINEHMMGRPPREMPYQPLGDLIIDFPVISSATNYRRTLDLDTAIATTSFRSGGVDYVREVFVSPADQVLAIRITASKPGKISFYVQLTTEQPATISSEAPATLVLSGKNSDLRGIPGALKIESRVRVVAEGGTAAASSKLIQVAGANSATIYLAAATGYKSYDDVSGNPAALTRSEIANAVSKRYSVLRARHIAEHQRLFRRVRLDLGHDSAAEQLPTDERIAKFDSPNDPQFAAMYFQFGRYLLISSSRPGTQPANLQGIWNDRMIPPWESSYTTNINTEMNYWPAEETNLAETAEPLIQMVMDLTHTGARVAKVDYGAGGWVTHHNTDLWRDAAPADQARSGMWPTGGAWLCLHLWDHYLYSGDKKYLAGIYPALKGASQFFLDTLVEEPTHHWLVTNPSLSPEHRHQFGTSIVDGPAMDEQILRDLFANTSRAAEVLGVDSDFRAQVLKTRDRLAPDQIGKAGQLQEWLQDWDLEAPEINYRHVSQLYAVYPSWQINVRDTPKLAAAAKKSLEIRGDEATGWGLAWRMNLWARLLEAEHAYKILTMMIRPDRTYPDMFDAHPPFQIDGNFGGTAGITEMLLQSHDGEIDLLPALPREWATGSVSGLRARGGFEIAMQWKDGKLISATVHSTSGNSATLRYGNQTTTIHPVTGTGFRWIQK